MSDAPQGDGWWEASDHKWYPPEQHADYKPTSIFSQARSAQRPRSEPKPEPEPEPEPSSRSGRGFAWLSWQSGLVLAAGLLAGFVLASTIGSDDGDVENTAVLGVAATTTPASTTTTSTTATSTTTTTEVPALSPEGSQASPLRLGQTATVGDWDVTVVGFTENATDAVIAAHEFNDRPTDWHVYSLVTLRGTYAGPDEASASLDLTVGFVGEDQRNHQDHDCDAVPPEPRVDDQSPAPTGGTVEGNVCLEVPIPQLESGALYVEQSSTFDDTRRWWATG